MKEIKKIQLINKALSSEKEKYLRELAKLNQFIERKLATINKIMSYQQEYQDNNNLKYSRSIPTLNKNIEIFSKRIDKVILQEKSEVKRLTTIRTSIVQKIETLGQKIKLMSHFETRAKSEKLAKLEKAEQLSMDDLSANKCSRGE